MRHVHGNPDNQPRCDQMFQSRQSTKNLHHSIQEAPNEENTEPIFQQYKPKHYKLLITVNNVIFILPKTYSYINYTFLRKHKN